ncbi:unnamed protein product, partial [Mesorhabditis spiculigera]
MRVLFWGLLCFGVSHSHFLKLNQGQGIEEEYFSAEAEGDSVEHEVTEIDAARILPDKDSDVISAEAEVEEPSEDSFREREPEVDGKLINRWPIQHRNTERLVLKRDLRHRRQSGDPEYDYRHLKEKPATGNRLPGRSRRHLHFNNDWRTKLNSEEIDALIREEEVTRYRIRRTLREPKELSYPMPDDDKMSKQRHEEKKRERRCGMFCAGPHSEDDGPQ